MKSFNKTQYYLRFSLLLAILVGLSMNIGLFAQNRKVDLKENLPFEEVLKMAKAQDKYIFLDFGSLTCKPCLYIKKFVLTLDSVADFINARFVSVDYNQGAEKDRLRKLYNVVGEPVLLILDQDGNFMHRMAGRVEGNELMERFRQGLDLQNNLVALEKQYNSGVRDKDLILKYLKTLQQAGEVGRMNKVYHEYTSGSLENLKKPEYFDVFYAYNDDVGSEEVLYMTENWQEFGKLFGSGKIDSKINKLFSLHSLKYLYGHTNPKEDPTFGKILNFLQKSQHPRASEWLCYLVPAQYKYEDWPRMAQEVDNIYKYNLLKGKAGVSFKDMMVTQFVMYCHDPEALVYGVKWCKELSEEADEKAKQNYQNTIKTFEERISKGKPEELEWH
ncbi:thioredoxin family protein [Sphingobacterium faecale]|uniref:Thioredoxin family protein n=1 Tax=Sphingobacterium faecale TaxID=2803775 RepID=A0ABS1R675_9SPHI|nr:thioredoxin family protein [Sphingobacterium faecale]MBL1409795.1 thioredoxin family protein [Sphingobacterium faecale]